MTFLLALLITAVVGLVMTLPRTEATAEAPTSQMLLLRSF